MSTHDRKTGLLTEKVEQGVQIEPGVYGSETFWIAYPPHILAYGHEADRIAAAWGRGKLRRDALAEAQHKIDDGRVVS
jgi:hypothetical protein